MPNNRDKKAFALRLPFAWHPEATRINASAPLE
jgi:hypothetical protein